MFGRAAVLAVVVFMTGCASGGIVGPDRDTGNGGSPDTRGRADTSVSDTATDVPVDTGPADTMTDVPVTDTPAPDTVEDVPTTDTPDPDIGSPDTPDPDIGSPDTPDPDTGPGCTGAGCACTVGTAPTVCGGLACVDGYCCNEACDGPCRACNVSGAEGTCTLFNAGTDPDNDCLLESPDTCGTTGECDGAGACAYYGSETTCNDGESCSTNDACDGGMCRGTVPDSCGPGAGNECCVGNCSDGSGCETVASACADVCTASELTIGQSCAGCGAPGAVGLCSGGGSHRCDADNHNLCQELSCGGVTYFCTERGGSWAWRTSNGCDDGDLCTYDDVCGTGTCGGTTIDCAKTDCADRTCNGTDTCTVTPLTGDPCEDGDLCTYNDSCNASGECAPGPSVTCSDTDCIDRECTGTGTCSETILTGSTCEDGDLCTYDDTCSSEGMCQGGPSISCTGMDTTCQSFGCDGTNMCAMTPTNIGGTCDDGNPITEEDVCQADGTCLGDEGCPPPADSCVDGSQNRRGCGNARTIGRVGASTGWVMEDDTCRAYDEFDDSSGCWDANADHTYRLYMREGEQATIRYETEDPCDFDEWNWQGTLKIFETGGCDDTGCRDKVYCDYNETDQTANYTASQDGWIIIVADGSSAFDDEGDYVLTVNLTCRDADCGCD